MGSFNETCAISGLPIEVGDKIKVVFLTESPYGTRSKGCYIGDYFFLRTPPISGKYADYGKCDFVEDNVTKLIEHCFSKDVVELPYGENEYHDPPISKNSSIDEFLQSAWENRLYVNSNQKDPPENFPTWKRVSKILEDKGQKLFPDNPVGYNPMPVENGIVAVKVGGYGHNVKPLLEDCAKLLEDEYDCHLDLENPYPKLILSPKGTSEDIRILSSTEESRLLRLIKSSNHSSPMDLGKKSSVFSVMIREDIWDVYKNAEYSSFWKDKDYSPNGFKNELKNISNELIESREDEFKRVLFSIKAESIFQDHPGVMSLQNHFIDMHDIFSGSDLDELIEVFAEAARVEYIKSALHQAWNIPILNGQESNWELHKAIQEKTQRIIQNKIKEQNEY